MPKNIGTSNINIYLTIKNLSPNIQIAKQFDNRFNCDKFYLIWKTTNNISQKINIKNLFLGFSYAQNSIENKEHISSVSLICNPKTNEHEIVVAKSNGIIEVFNYFILLKTWKKITTYNLIKQNAKFFYITGYLHDPKINKLILPAIYQENHQWYLEILNDNSNCRSLIPDKQIKSILHNSTNYIFNLDQILSEYSPTTINLNYHIHTLLKCHLLDLQSSIPIMQKEFPFASNILIKTYSDSIKFETLDNNYNNGKFAIVLFNNSFAKCEDIECTIYKGKINISNDGLSTKNLQPITRLKKITINPASSLHIKPKNNIITKNTIITVVVKSSLSSEANIYWGCFPKKYFLQVQADSLKHNILNKNIC